MHVHPHAGAIYPAAGPMTKDAGRAIKKCFGPIDGWFARYTAAEPTLHLTTAAAEYLCLKPTPEFRTLYTDVQEQVQLCHALVQTLKSKDGWELSFEGALAALNRAKVIKGYFSIRNAVLLNGPFVLHQLPAMQTAVGSTFVLEECPFFKELRAEVRSACILGLRKETM
jgi:hypothetical protein